jgi:hypothetical protein
VSRWTTTTEQQLRVELATQLQRAARAEGEAAALRQTVELLDAANRLTAATKEIERLQAQIQRLYDEQRESLARSQQQPTVVAWPNGVSR